MELLFINYSGWEFSQSFFEELAKKTFEKENREHQSISFEVVLVGENRIREINKRYAGKNQITDVLSFPDKEIKKPAKQEIKFIEPPGRKENLGEIIICPSRVKKQAKREKREMEKELAHVFVHGLLHLLGYDHVDTEGTKKMRKKEKEILQS